METDGFFCIDKPKGFTSFDVIARLRRILGIKKLGHAGTLDPMADGILLILTGRAAKASDILPIKEKRYTAKFKLGVITDTQDMTGKVLSQCKPDIDNAELKKVIGSFAGEICQTPPMFSAVQVGGRRLYDLARKGIEIERQERSVTISSIDLLDYTDDSFTLDVLCSRGTYIRTLGHDIGNILGCGAAMSELRRTMEAGFDLSAAHTLDDIERAVKNGEISNILRPLNKLFSTLPKLILSDVKTIMFQNGVKLWTSAIECPDTETDIAVYSCDGRFLGVAYKDADKGQLICRRLFLLKEAPA